MELVLIADSVCLLFWDGNFSVDANDRWVMRVQAMGMLESPLVGENKSENAEIFGSTLRKASGEVRSICF